MRDSQSARSSVTTAGFERLIWAAVCLAGFLMAYVYVNSGVASLSVLVLIISSMLVRSVASPFSTRVLSIFGFWYATYLPMIFLPAFFVYADHEGPFRAGYLFAVQSVLLTVPFGALLVNGITGFSRDELEGYNRKPILVDGEAARVLPAFKLLLCAALGITLIHLTEMQSVPLLHLVTNPGDYFELTRLREESFKLLDSPLSYVYFVTRGLLYPLLIMLALGFYLQTKQRTWLILFTVSLIAGVLYASLSLAKSPVAAIILALGFFYFLYRGGRVSRRLIASLVALALLFPLSVIIMVSDAADFGVLQGLQAIGRRLFYEPSEVVYYYFEVFPHYVNYLYGRSIGKLAWAMGADYFNTPNYVATHAYSYLGVYFFETEHANGAFIGDLNADFGMWGVIAGGVLVGAIIQGFQVYVTRQRKSITSLASYAFLVFAFWNLNSTSAPTVLASSGAIFCVLLATWLQKSGPSRRFSLLAERRAVTT